MPEDQTKIRVRLSENFEYLIPTKDYILLSQGKERPALQYSEICQKTKLLWDKSAKWTKVIRLELVPKYGGGYELIERTYWQINFEALEIFQWAKALGCLWAKDLVYPPPPRSIR